MQLSSLINPEKILLSLDVQDKEECIEAMAGSLQKAGHIQDMQEYLEAVFSRELAGSTGVGFGVAIPHGKSAAVSHTGLAFAKLANPIEWKSLDDQPVSLVFLIAVTEEKAGDEHLQILAAVSRKLIHEDFRQSLFEAQTADDVLHLLGS